MFKLSKQTDHLLSNLIKAEHQHNYENKKNLKKYQRFPAAALFL